MLRSDYRWWTARPKPVPFRKWAKTLWLFNPPLTWPCPTASMESLYIFGFTGPKDEKFTLIDCFSHRIWHRKRKEWVNRSNMAAKSVRTTVGPRTRWVKRRNATSCRCICFNNGFVDMIVWGVVIRGLHLLFLHRGRGTAPSQVSSKTAVDSRLGWHNIDNQWLLGHNRRLCDIYQSAAGIVPYKVVWKGPECLSLRTKENCFSHSNTVRTRMMNRWIEGTIGIERLVSAKSRGQLSKKTSKPHVPLKFSCHAVKRV